jgi:AcrR family transcriptional regulator
MRTYNGVGHTGVKRTRGARGPGNKKRIFEAAIELFFEKGYGATTTDAICVTAKIAKPTLYYYAGSKRHLFYQLHMEAIKKDLLPHLEKVSSIKDPLNRLPRMVLDFARIICTHPELRVLIHEPLGMRDDYFREVRQLWKKHYCLLRDTISELQEQGVIPDAFRPSRLALLSLGMLAWIPFWLDYKRKKGAGEVALDAAHIVLRGLLGKTPVGASGT